MRIMIVERNPVLGRRLKDWVAAHGYRVSLTSDGASARTMIRASAHDVLVLDASLVVRDNLCLLDSWRAWGGNKPVLLWCEPKDAEELTERIGASLRKFFAGRVREFETSDESQD